MRLPAFYILLTCLGICLVVLVIHYPSELKSGIDVGVLLLYFIFSARALLVLNYLLNVHGQIMFYLIL